MDLNNLFIGGDDPEGAVAAAEAAGFPRTTCAWIKGLYGVARAAGIRKVVAVEGGDCSNTNAWAEVLAAEGVEIIPFSYPSRPDERALASEIERFAARLGTTAAAAEEVFAELRPVRAALAEADTLTWREGRVTGQENFEWLLAATDFEGDVESFRERLAGFLAGARARPARPEGIRVGLAGVPPINRDLFAALAQLGADVVFNEIPRQFALGGGGASLVTAYTSYTYPYGAGGRCRDLAAAVAERRLAGIVHYVQTFCHRGIHDILLRGAVPVPVLTLEGDRPGPLSAQQRLRLETFVEMLRGRAPA